MSFMFDFVSLAEFLLGSVGIIIGAYIVGEVANLLATTRAINAIQNTASSAINAVVSVHNTTTVTQLSQSSQQNNKNSDGGK